MRFLQEHRSQEEIVGTDRAVPEGRCCNGWGCTPGTLHDIVTTVPPVVHDVGAKPSQGTMAWFALQHLEKWCSEAAANLEDYRDMVGRPPGSFVLVLRPQQQWLIAQQFSKVKEKDDWKLKTVSDLRKLIPPEQWMHSAQLEAQLVQVLDDGVEKIIKAYQERRKKSKAGRRDSTSSESSKNTDDSSALSRAAKDNAVARKTIQDEAEERRDRERARAVRIGATEVIPITDDVPDKGSYPERGPTTPATRTPISNPPIVIRSRKQSNPPLPVTPIPYRNGGKRPTSTLGSRRGGEVRKASQADVQSSESDVESPELPETPVLQLRRPSAVVEGAEGRGARRIKYTSQFRGITDKEDL